MLSSSAKLSRVVFLCKLTGQEDRSNLTNDQRFPGVRRPRCCLATMSAPGHSRPKRRALLAGPLPLRPQRETSNADEKSVARSHIMLSVHLRHSTPRQRSSRSNAQAVLGFSQTGRGPRFFAPLQELAGRDHHDLDLVVGRSEFSLDGRSRWRFARDGNSSGASDREGRLEGCGRGHEPDGSQTRHRPCGRSGG